MLLTIFVYCLGNLFTINDLNMRNRIILCKDEDIDMCKGGGQKRVCISLTCLIFYCRQQFTLIRIMTSLLNGVRTNMSYLVCRLLSYLCCKLLLLSGDHTNGSNQ